MWVSQDVQQIVAPTSFSSNGFKKLSLKKMQRCILFSICCLQKLPKKNSQCKHCPQVWRFFRNVFYLKFMIATTELTWCLLFLKIFCFLATKMLSHSLTTNNLLQIICLHLAPRILLCLIKSEPKMPTPPARQINRIIAD